MTDYPWTRPLEQIRVYHPSLKAVNLNGETIQEIHDLSYEAGKMVVALPLVRELNETVEQIERDRKERRP
jgi:hypothetical protein